MSRLAGRGVEEAADEHVRFEVFVGSMERVAGDAEMLRLWGDLLAADADPVMAESAALRVLEPAASAEVVAEIGRALGDRALIAHRLAELDTLAELSSDTFGGDLEAALRNGSGWAAREACRTRTLARSSCLPLGVGQPPPRT